MRLFYLKKNKDIVNLPINPDLPTKIYRAMSKLGVLNYYQSYMLKQKTKSLIKNLK